MPRRRSPGSRRQPTAALASSPFSLALGGMCALAVGVGVGRFVYTPILPVMVETLGLTQGQAGLIASANFLGYLVGALLASSPHLSGSSRSWLLAALAVNAAAMAAMTLSESIALFLLMRFIGGVASAFILVFASAFVLDRLAWCGRGELSAVHFSGVGVGIAVSAAIVTSLLRTGGSWMSLWWASATLAALGAVVVAGLVGEPVGVSKRPPAVAGRPFDADLAKLVLAYGLFGFGYVITATFLVALVRAHAEIADLEPAVWVAFGVVAAPSVAAWSWAGRRLGVCRAFALACVVEAVGVAASVLWLSETGAAIATLSLGGTFMGITALGLVAARGLAVGDAHRNLALMTAAFGLGQIIGPTFAGYAYDRTGDFVIPSMVAAAGLVLAAALVLRIPVTFEKK